MFVMAQELRFFSLSIKDMYTFKNDHHLIFNYAMMKATITFHQLCSGRIQQYNIRDPYYNEVDHGALFQFC